MTKMATMPYMVKTIEDIFLWNRKADDLVYSIEYSSTTKFVQMMPLGWP